MHKQMFILVNLLRKDGHDPLAIAGCMLAGAVQIYQSELGIETTQDLLDQIANGSDDIDFDLDVMWENTVWEEIQDVVDVVAEVEQITAVAGVRGAEAEDEALEHLYYRRSMKGLALIDLQKAYGKLMIKRDKILKENPNNPKLKKINTLISQLESKINRI